jgi:aldehyde:ferredoxin oxidoreductase
MGIRERVGRLLAEMPRDAQFPSQGATLFVDLERRETTRAFTPLGVTRTVLGGRGANMYYLYRLLDETLTPLDPDIPMIFGSGLLTGLVPSAARGNCSSWSPESGVLLDANAGDYFPSFLRMNGFDHIVLYGKAPAWTLIVIREGVVTFEDASPYVGMDNLDMREAIARDLGGTWARNMAMVNITRAGEHGVLTGGVMGGPKAIYARGGPGAKMGAFGLKGIVTIAQTKEFPTAQPYKPYNRVIAQKLLATSVVKNALSTKGTPFLYKPSRLLGAMGTKNNQETTWTEGLDAEHFDQYRPGMEGCFRCPVNCRPRVRDARQVRPEPRHRSR